MAVRRAVAASVVGVGNVNGLPSLALAELYRRLTVANPKYEDAARFNRWTGNLEPELRYYEQFSGGELSIPRGAGGLMSDLCRRYGVELDLHDATVLAPPVDFETGPSAWLRTSPMVVCRRPSSSWRAERRAQLSAPMLVEGLEH